MSARVCQKTINFKICHAGGHVPPQGHLEKKNSGEQRQSRLRSWFSSKRGYHGGIVLHSKPYAEQGFAAVIAFVLRERCRLCRHAQADTKNVSAQFRYLLIAAMSSTSTRTSFGSSFAATQERAGFSVKYCP